MEKKMLLDKLDNVFLAIDEICDGGSVVTFSLFLAMCFFYENRSHVVMTSSLLLIDCIIWLFHSGSKLASSRIHFIIKFYNQSNFHIPKFNELVNLIISYNFCLEFMKVSINRACSRETSFNI